VFGGRRRLLAYCGSLRVQVGRTLVSAARERGYLRRVARLGRFLGTLDWALTLFARRIPDSLSNSTQNLVG